MKCKGGTGMIVTMRTEIRHAHVVYQVWQGRKRAWQVTTPVGRSTYRQRRLTAWRQEQVARALIDIGEVPFEYPNEVNTR